MDTLRLDAMSNADIEALDWYYRVELKPGAFTNGTPRPNMTATRALIDRVDWNGMRVLDVGAQEGVFCVLLAKAGADVTGYDRFDLSDRIDLIQQAYCTSFCYVGGQTFPEFVRETHTKERELYDGIFFSGVLYHVLEPTLFVYLVRTLLKPGGILVLETIAAVDEDAALFFNADGRFWNGPGSYYVTATGWLDYYLRFLGFKIVDVEYTGERSRSAKATTRVALTAILTDGHPVRDDDYFGRRMPWDLLDFQALKRGQPRFDGDVRVRPAPYEESLYHEGITPRTLNVTGAVGSKKPAPRGQHLRILELSREPISSPRASHRPRAAPHRPTHRRCGA